MKSLLSTTIFLYSICSIAGVAGTSGGSVHKLLVRNNIASAWVCGRGEPGTDCQWINFKIRPPSQVFAQPKPQACVIYFGEEAYRPCPEKYGTVVQELTSYLSQ